MLKRISEYCIKGRYDFFQTTLLALEFSICVSESLQDSFCLCVTYYCSSIALGQLLVRLLSG